jgi:hypothetical protein
MTTTTVTPVVATTPRLLLLGGAALVVGAVLELVYGLVESLLPQSPLSVIGFITPVVLAVAAVLLALGGIGGRSALARIGLFVYAGAYAILLIASIAAMTGNVIELLFPLGGTLLTFGLLVAGIEVARVGAVGGYARWGLLLLGVWMLFIDIAAFAGLDLAAIANADGPGIAGALVRVALLAAEGIAIIVAARFAHSDRNPVTVEH